MSEANKTFVSSPLLFLRPRQHCATMIEAATGSAFQKLTMSGAKLLAFSVTPRTLAEAQEAGFLKDELEAGFDADLIVWTDDPRFEAAKLWERSNWSRAAYLLFSQFGLEYAENSWNAETLDQHVSGRRQQINSYLACDHYPARFWDKPAGPVIKLPEPDVNLLRLRLDRLAARRSVRSFAVRPLSISELSRVLFGATANVRLAKASQAQGDPFFLLNSFYSWLGIYVAIQGVDSIPRGFYQYNGEVNSLTPLGKSASDKDIAAVIANQNWIKGGGFCLFVVADWSRYMWLYRHSRAYINLLTQIGEFSQEVIQHASNCGLGGWMTPAIDEHAAAVMLGIDETRMDTMLFMKIGVPAGADPVQKKV